MNSGIIVPQWNKRTLQKGFAWQRYFIPCIRLITEEEFRVLYNSSYAAVKDHFGAWKGQVASYIVRRCQELGLHLVDLQGQLGDQPHPDKALETVIWNMKKAQFVAAVWAFIEGPVKEDLVNESDMPLENFWPAWVRQYNGIAEILDARKLTLIEQGLIASEDEYDR